MEKRNKTTKKLLSMFWFICMSAPLLVLIVLFINGTYRQEFTLSFNTYNQLAETYIESDFGNFTSNLFNNFLSKFEEIFYEEVIENATLTTFNSIIYWYMFVSLIHLVVDIVLFIPNIIKLALKKVGVKDVE